ncbi:hypothetical protein Q5H93_18905 [Hymenobacter sp. ASUV-10]|uniref:DUF4254 domain-containing protein n=1 Tax=Hymenobacter aranciens TaxID=3063996 RepID=A0ABT9BII6_9BACT|nr:hypothetical protein [Hymenobacter sp. ASUV-10]MDO7876822.1 hypothetical protein [Hymenobacter sp. ASUV-10]
MGQARSSIAESETGRRPPSIREGYWERSRRLTLAAIGKALDPLTGDSLPGLPPLPPLPPAAQPLQDRVRDCRHRIRNLQYDLADMQEKAKPYEARRAALPTLLPWTGPDPSPDLAAAWLDLFEKEAEVALLYTCGAGPQRLLQARIAGLERECELLEELLAPLPPAP